MPHLRVRGSEKEIMDKLNASAQLREAEKKTLARDLYHVRLAGYLLVFASPHAQTASVANSIVSATEAVALGAFYDRYFVRTCK